MRHISLIRLGCSLTFVCLLSGCLNEEYNTQYFKSGEATCLAGKQLHFGDSPVFEKSAPYPHYPRYVLERSSLPVDPTEHATIDFSVGDPFELSLPPGNVLTYYGEDYLTLYIGSDGTIAFGAPGPGNNTVVDIFSAPQISLLPVDATAEGAIVRYALTDFEFVLTFENVQGNTFQFELFRQDERQSEMAITYEMVSENTRAGVVGIPDPQHPILGDDPRRFAAFNFRNSMLCEDSPFNSKEFL